MVVAVDFRFAGAVNDVVGKEVVIDVDAVLLFGGVDGGGALQLARELGLGEGMKTA